jgi:uncharacterized protein YcnI
MFRSFIVPAAALAAGVLVLGPAHGHAKLDPAEAAAGSTYQGVLRIGHGCAGSPTRRVRLLVPQDIVVAPRAAAPGWTVDTVRAPRGHAAGQHAHHGGGVPAVTEIVWSGRLPDKEKADFAFTADLPANLDAPHGLPLPVVQECEQGEHRWVEVATPGRSHKDLKSPAPVLKITPAGAPAVAAAVKHHVHIHGEKAMADVVIEPRVGTGRLTVVPMTMDFGALDAKAITVSFTQPGGAALESAVARTPEGPWTTNGFALPRPGRWIVTLTITLATGDTLILRDALDVPGPAS